MCYLHSEWQLSDLSYEQTNDIFSWWMQKYTTFDRSTSNNVIIFSLEKNECFDLVRYYFTKYFSQVMF